MPNVTAPLRALAARSPAAAALILADDRTIDRAGLEARIDAAARRLQALGLRSGQTVGLAITGPDEALALILGLALARLGIASAEPGLPGGHLAAALVQPGAAPPPGVPAHTIDQDWLAGPPGPTVPIAEAGVLRIFATSGSTGRPSQVPVTHAAMLERIEGKGWPIASSDWPARLVCAMGLGGHAGLRGILTALLAGGTVAFSNPDQLGTTILRHQISVLALSPHTLQHVLERLPRHLGGTLPPLRALRVSGSQLPAPLAREAAARLCANVVTTFGATETGNICAGRWDAFPDIPLAIGRILPEAEVEAIDEDGQPLPPGAEGLLRFRTPGMATHYLDDPAGSAARFQGGWFVSGDRGHVTPDRVLVVTGRTGEFINSGGVKISPRVIEAALLEIAGVREAAAFAAPDRHGLAQVWAAIVPAAPIPQDRLSAECNRRLGHAAPAFVLQMPALPRNANGKVALPELIRMAVRHLHGPAAG